MLFLTSCHHPQPIYCVSELQGLAGGHSGALRVCCNIQLRERRASFILFALSVVHSLPYQGFHPENARAVAECKGCNICALNEETSGSHLSRRGSRLYLARRQLKHLMEPRRSISSGPPSWSSHPFTPQSYSAMTGGTCRLLPAARGHHRGLPLHQRALLEVLRGE